MNPLRLSVRHFRRLITIFYSVGALPLLFEESLRTSTVELFGVPSSPLFVWLALYIVSALTVGAITITANLDDGLTISQDEYDALPKAKISKDWPDVDVE